jgi:hypothetical protein
MGAAPLSNLQAKREKKEGYLLVAHDAGWL